MIRVGLVGWLVGGVCLIQCVLLLCSALLAGTSSTMSWFPLSLSVCVCVIGAVWLSTLFFFFFFLLSDVGLGSVVSLATTTVLIYSLGAHCVVLCIAGRYGITTTTTPTPTTADRRRWFGLCIL